MPTKMTARQKDKLIEAAQNAVEFTVTGRNGFPLDMLRYDRCWPATGSDAGKVASTLWVTDKREDQDITLRGLIVPHAQRWASFGWRVLVSDQGVQ